MQHFAVCTLLMGCQDSARECHCAVCHHAIRVEARCGDMQVSFPAHLFPALLLLAAHGNIPTTPSSSFSALAAGRRDWGVSKCSESLLWVRGWSSAFPCHGTTIPNHRAVACGGVPGPSRQHWRGNSPPKPIADMGIVFCSEKQRRKVFSHNLILCHCVQVQNQLKKEIILLPL